MAATNFLDAYANVITASAASALSEPSFDGVTDHGVAGVGAEPASAPQGGGSNGNSAPAARTPIEQGLDSILNTLQALPIVGLGFKGADTIAKSVMGDKQTSGETSLGLSQILTSVPLVILGIALIIVAVIFILHETTAGEAVESASGATIKHVKGALT